MRLLLAAATATALATFACAANAQPVPQPVQPTATESSPAEPTREPVVEPPRAVAAPVVETPRGVDALEVEKLERLKRESTDVRRVLADSVLVAGVASAAGGSALIAVRADDLAWRFAGINTAIFGVINTLVGLRALRGIAIEERAWESPEARAARRTPEGLVRARIHAAIDERRESVGHAINLGLDGAYVGVGGTAILVSQLGADHPKRWLASGVAILAQAAFLLGVDFIGLARSGTYHRMLVEDFAPSISILPSASGTEMRFDLKGAL